MGGAHAVFLLNIIYTNCEWWSGLKILGNTHIRVASTPGKSENTWEYLEVFFTPGITWKIPIFPFLPGNTWNFSVFLFEILLSLIACNHVKGW